MSYSSVLDRSISTRRQALYKTRGFDIERWLDLVTEAKTLRKEISKIAEDYDDNRWKEHDKDRTAQVTKETEAVEDMKKSTEETDEAEDRKSQ